MLLSVLGLMALLTFVALCCLAVQPPRCRESDDLIAQADIAPTQAEASDSPQR